MQTLLYKQEFEDRSVLTYGLEIPDVGTVVTTEVLPGNSASSVFVPGVRIQAGTVQGSENIVYRLAGFSMDDMMRMAKAQEQWMAENSPKVSRASLLAH